MSTYDYLTPTEALFRAQSDAPDYQRIIGLRGVDADRIPGLITRTKAGYARKPSDPWRAHGFLDRFKEITAVQWAEDGDPGTIEVHWADGTADYLHKEDLLCVERPV